MPLTQARSYRTASISAELKRELSSYVLQMGFVALFAVILWERSELAFLKARAVFMKSKGTDLKGAIAALEAAQVLAPDTQIGKQIPNILKGLEAQLKKAQAEKAPGPKAPAKPKKSE